MTFRDLNLESTSITVILALIFGRVFILDHKLNRLHRDSLGQIIFVNRQLYFYTIGP